MEQNSELQKDNIDKWADMWDKAQADGIFPEAPEPQTVSPYTADDSFFGLQTTNPTEAPASPDTDYWNNLHQMNEPRKEELLRDATDLGQSWTDPKTKGKKYPPNPVKVDSGGKDQKLKPKQLGVTFDEEDIEKVIEIKSKLHDLGSKLAADPHEGNKKIESQIETLKKQLDELSSAMGYGIPNDLSAEVKRKEE
jgi:hypothetical protein